MMEHLTDKIHDYCEGLLQGEELKEFEMQLEVDEDFRNLVKLHKEVNNIIRNRVSSDEISLRANLKDAERLQRAEKLSPIKRLRPLISVLSAACILVFAYLFIKQSTDTFYELPTMQSEVVRGQEADVQYEEAVQLYNEKSYTAARSILEKLITQEPEVVQYQYYAALTYIGEENWAAAQTALKGIATGESIFRDEAKYFLAVALYKQEQKAQAITVLKEIPQQGALGKRVELLLKKIN